MNSPSREPSSPHPHACPATPGRGYPPLPEAVTSFGAVTAGGWLYVCGGHRGARHAYSRETVSGAFHRLHLDPRIAAPSWEPLPGVEPAQGAPLVEWGGKIIRPGGMAARNPSGQPSDLHSSAAVWTFDTAGGVWEAGVELPEPRSSHEAVECAGVLYVGGGWGLSGAASSGRWCSEVWSLDLRPPKPRWVATPQPFRRRALAMAASRGLIFFLGGIDDSGEPSRAVDILDTRTGGWAAGPELPAGPMQGFGSAAIGLGDRVYWNGLGGGLYSLGAGESGWRREGELVCPRFFHRLAAGWAGRLLALGGEGGGDKRNDLEEWTPQTPSPNA